MKTRKFQIVHLLFLTTVIDNWHQTTVCFPLNEMAHSFKSTEFVWWQIYSAFVNLGGKLLALMLIEMYSTCSIFYFLRWPSSSLHPPQLLKGFLVFTWVWFLHVLSLMLCPSPDTTCFYYNSIFPLVLKSVCVCVCAASHTFIKNGYSSITACSNLCCCFSPSLPFGQVFLLSFSPIFFA